MNRSARLTFLLIAAFTIAVVSVGGAPQPVAAADYAQILPLHTWYSPSRGDNFTTSNPAWSPSNGTTRSPDYGFVGLQGYVHTPSEPRPLDTTPLYSWYSPSRGDNFVTSNPAWAGSPGSTRSPDYRFVRMEGYVFTRPLMGTVPLFSWYSSGRADNFATTNPLWSGGPGAVHSPDYGFVRIEGYIYRSENTDFGSFGYGSMRADGRPATGLRPLLTMMLNFRDLNFRTGHDRTWIERTLFGTASRPYANAYFAEVSGGAFGFSSAGTYAFQQLDDAGTPMNEATYAGSCIEGGAGAGGSCPGSYSNIFRLGARAIRAAATRGVDFSRFDTNRNGRVENGELSLLIYHASPVGKYPGANRGTDPSCVRPAGQSVDICIDIAWVAEGASFSTIVHEMSHSFGTIDIYGSANNNDAYSLMASTIVSNEDDLKSVHFDPWHKIALGWTTPRIIEMRQPGDCAYAASQSRMARTWEQRPFLFFDSARGQKDFFLVELRTGQIDTTTRYDDMLPDPSGFAIWQVRLGSPQHPAVISGLKIGAGNDRILQSTVSTGSDDVYEYNPAGARSGIFAGNDRVLQSRLAGDDVRVLDRADNLIMPAAWKRGVGPLVSQVNAARPPWLDRTSSVLSLSIPTVRPTSTYAELDWNLATTAPRIDRLVATMTGPQLVFNGRFGTSRQLDVEFTYKEDVVRFAATGVSCGQLTIRPTGLYSGSWTMVAYDHARPSLRSNAVTVIVP